MTQFAYTAIPIGKPGAAAVNGRREASSERALRDDLRAHGMVAIEVRPLRITDALRASVSSSRPRRSDGVWFSSTLKMLLDAAVPVEQALGTMEDLAPNERLKGLCARVRERLRSGTSLADAVSSCPGLMRPQHLALLRAGHESGQLAHALSLIDQSVAMQERIRRSVMTRLAYPATLLVVGVLVLWVLSTAVMPKFAEALESMGGQLPAITTLTLGTGRALTWLIPLAGVGVLLAAAMWRTMRTDALRARLARVAMRTPLVRDLVWHAQGAALTDTLATILEGGGDVLLGLGQARDVVSSPEIASRLVAATRQVREGTDLGQAFKRECVLPPMVGALLEASIRAGDLVGGLRRAAEACVAKQERLAERLMALLGPGVVILLATLVGWVAYAMVAGMLAINDLQGI